MVLKYCFIINIKNNLQKPKNFIVKIIAKIFNTGDFYHCYILLEKEKKH